MLFRPSHIAPAAALALVLVLAGCGPDTAPGVADAAAGSAPDTSAVATVAADRPSSAAGVPTAASADPDAAAEARAEARELIVAYRSIRLTPEQERLKVEALSRIPAPCCSRFSLATCCCPCNMAKAAWGLAARLISEEGAGVEEVRAAATAWLEKVNPDGFSGQACFTGGCDRAFRHDGCGGMEESHVL